MSETNSSDGEENTNDSVQEAILWAPDREYIDKVYSRRNGDDVEIAPEDWTMFLKYVARRGVCLRLTEDKYMDYDGRYYRLDGQPYRRRIEEISRTDAESILRGFDSIEAVLVEETPFADEHELRADGGRPSDGTYRVNGHKFEVCGTYEDGDVETLQCRECLIREVLDDEDDPEEYLDLMTPECQIVWLRDPDGGFHGIALRNASGFQGRELIGVKEEGGPLGEGEVADRVRVYDEDARQLQSLLDLRSWENMGVSRDA